MTTEAVEAEEGPGADVNVITGAITHIAGAQVQVGSRLRQRCSWCGAVLCDYDLTRIAVLAGQDPTPGMWETGRLVEVDGNASWVVEHEEGAEIPANACARLDDEVTL
jgi:hypothetical protein